MGRDGERCQTIYFFIYVMSGMGSGTPVVVLDPCPHVPILPNTAETYLGPQLGVVPFSCPHPQLPLSPQEPGMESGLQGTHSGPDSSSVACTGSLSWENCLAARWREADKDADLNMPGLVDIQAVHREDSALAASVSKLTNSSTLSCRRSMVSSLVVEAGWLPVALRSGSASSVGDPTGGSAAFWG